ncbi:unnamed protein product [Trifolium pratense]|uniref:Uncharacterized protein n=1 Tax=Trifolium pratense TaxID=57577 RepID=A0ACB0L7Z5_TRIPR|nr:unnamed protein product [Trifolium pratense]
MSNLICLQTIKWFLSEDDVLSTKDVSKLFNLRHLELHGWICRDKTQPVGFGKLSLQQHGAMIFSKWLSPLTNITEIYLNSCRGFEYLPPLERLPFLKSLELASLNELKYIYYEEPILKESFFPSLESLQIGGCKELRGWRKMGDDFDDVNSSYHLMLPQFPCLSKLVINWCLMLTCIPTFPTIKILYMKDCTVEILEETLNIAASQYSIGFTSLSMLKYLKINKTIIGGKNFPQNWLQTLTSLENLDITYLSNQDFQENEMWLKADLNCLPSLQKIRFGYCCHLNALPDWICNISSLQHIEITCCIELVLLPEGMSRLTKLRTLELDICPLLIEECRTKTSATWSKISHIPNIIIHDSN